MFFSAGKIWYNCSKGILPFQRRKRSAETAADTGSNGGLGGEEAGEWEFASRFMGLPEPVRRSLGHQFGATSAPGWSALYPNDGMFRKCRFRGQDCAKKE